MWRAVPDIFQWCWPKQNIAQKAGCPVRGHRNEVSQASPRRPSFNDFRAGGSPERPVFVSTVSPGLPDANRAAVWSSKILPVGPAISSDLGPA